MAKLHNLGLPRIGEKRQLKKALESYWKGKSDAEQLLQCAASVQQQNFARSSALDFLQVGDFSFYDQVLDCSFMLGNVPERALEQNYDPLDVYFRAARGRSPADSCGCGVSAGEMTKWFDTNYHYIVPEFTGDTQFSLNPEALIEQVRQAKACGKAIKPVVIGPVTYLWLGKAKDGSDKLKLLKDLLPVYAELFEVLDKEGVQWIQIDEPALVTELEPQWQQAYLTAYRYLAARKVKLLLTTYFGELKDNLALVASLPVDGVHIDAIRAKKEVDALKALLDPGQVLSVGLIDGRNIWKTDLNQALDFIEPIAKELGERLWLAPSCSLLHVPVDLAFETALDEQIKDWLAFAVQKLEELEVIAVALKQGREAVAKVLAQNAQSLQNRRTCRRVTDDRVAEAQASIKAASFERKSRFEQRAKLQRDRLNLPLYPTTTIGSFPQTPHIRKARRQFKTGELNQAQYVEQMQAEIADCIARQERLGLDVLVHGEAERNDMVEYFGEQLQGFVFTQNGWVQSYGSRCVKPPVIYGDVSRPKPMTVEWTRYAQSLSAKPVKGMLTGPVTILNWSFVRDDQPRAKTCEQLALAVREEVLDLERAGIEIIQIDEAALREGLPLRKSQWQDYLDWAVGCFKLCANGVLDSTQIHTHMCYSQFNDIIEAIAKMDADVITIETSRSDMALLSVFERFNYPNEIGPGVYDIHSPNIPSVESIVQLISMAAKYIPKQRLWINPDCGLKTRNWDEVTPALNNMLTAAEQLRQQA